MNKIEYWSLDCDILGGPKDRAVKIATAQMPEIAKDIANAMNAPGDPVVTCVYCGHEYPDGTPTAKHDLLTAHIKVCEKHPMREAEARIERLRKALSGLIGAETKEELEAMEAAMRMMPGIEADKIAGINAIHALLSEVNAKMEAPNA